MNPSRRYNLGSPSFTPFTHIIGSMEDELYPCTRYYNKTPYLRTDVGCLFNFIERYIFKHGATET